MIWGYQSILSLKNYAKKLKKFTKFLNYIKSSCVIFCDKMFKYSHYIYYLQDESTNFGVRVLRNFDLRCQNILSQKNHTKKLTKFRNIFELLQVFIHNFFSRNVSISPNHILPTRTKNLFVTYQLLYTFHQ